MTKNKEIGQGSTDLAAGDMDSDVSIMDLRELHESVEALSETAQKMEEQLDSIKITKNAISTIVDTSKGTEILAPLADGIFVKAKLHEDKTLLVHIGAGKTVEKTASQVKEMIGRHEAKLSEQIKILEKQIEDQGGKLIEMMSSYESQ
ncbi:prefoldin subunit alpha [archaeon]|jgi:prefoldin alpha subunit|nr:prefoldin subunit alpha [archaeon]MBT6698622.1 prefoldin subunit alpha [archaeon]